ncbi:hypothetical protein F4803DRAFT_189714 [Xylaria telfairii]|nr:hypothetical protein F4803DRAFT_189714 [Xylaria telfairii]
MLSSIGRSVAAGRLTSTNFATSFVRSVVVRAVPKSLSNAPGIYRPSSQAIRGLASLARPKKTTSSAATTAAKKPVKKSTTKTTKAKAKASPKSKSTAKSKAKPKAKAKAKAKPKPKVKRVRKGISPERQKILERRSLKRIALFAEPKALPEQPYQLFVVERTQGKSDGQSVVGKMAAVARDFKAVPSQEAERLKSVAEKNKLANAAAYKAWVESHSVQDIYDANRARRSLKKKFDIPKKSVKVIDDVRIPKRPATPFGLFTKARWASGEYSTEGVRITDITLRIASEWKEQTAAQRKPYEDLARSQSEQYVKEMDALVNRKRRLASKSPSP